MNKYITELIGTFFLVLTIGCTVIAGGAGVIPPLAIGAILMTMIYAGGHVSGAHYNPAVTVGVWMRGKCTTADAGPYIVAQLIGAVLASLVVGFLKGGVAVSPMEIQLMPALLSEMLFTFALVYVVLNVATASATANNSYFGLAIGMTVMAGAFAVGGISGGAFNPAVTVGASIMGLASWGNLIGYVVAQLVGAAVAATIFKLVNPKDI